MPRTLENNSKETSERNSGGGSCGVGGGVDERREGRKDGYMW